MSENYKDNIKYAIENGILMDFCGCVDRDYYFGVYSDFCGFNFSSVQSGDTGSTKEIVTITTSISGDTITCKATKETTSNVTINVTYQYLNDSGTIQSGTTNIVINSGYNEAITKLTMSNAVLKSISISPSSDDKYTYKNGTNISNNTAYKFMYKLNMSTPINEQYIIKYGTKFTLSSSQKAFTFEIKPNDADQYTDDLSTEELNKWITDNKLYYAFCFAIDNTIDKSTISILDDNIDKMADGSYIKTKSIKIEDHIYNIYEFADISHSLTCYKKYYPPTDGYMSEQEIKKN